VLDLGKSWLTLSTHSLVTNDLLGKDSNEIALWIKDNTNNDIFSLWKKVQTNNNLPDMVHMKLTMMNF